FYAGLKPPPYKSVFKGRYDEAPYVTEHVRSILKAVNPDKNIYYEGGFKIETTIQLDLQKQAILDTQKHVDYLTGKKGGIKKVWLKKDEKPPVSDDSTLQAAVIGLDPQTGEILFMHGGGDRFHQDNQLNRAIQIRRQTGSSIKPVLYAAAIDSGKVHTGMRVMDAKVFYRGKNGEKDWTPNNFDKEYLGEISLRTALEKSKNTVAVQIAEKIGLSTVARYYQQFFFPDPQEYKKRYRDDLSVALGSLEFSPLEMATVFSSFANDGKIQRPYLIRRITSSTGKVIYEYDLNDEFNMKIPFERRVVNPDTAEVMISLMTSSARYSSVRKTGYKGIVAGKTGTTNDYKDAWFVGLKPNLSLAVWIGYDDSAYGMGPKGVGSLAAAPLWGTIAAHADTLAVLPKRSFTFSKNAEQIEICKETGLDASACPCEAKEKEFFTSKAKPSKECIAPAVDKSNSIQSLF
ncbi:MAG: carboxypeptidase, partial [Leptospiraceae bacterium]|nr:carboxypeptidase [Leptospiraceae bacterium]